MLANFEEMEGTGMINDAAVRQESRKLWQYLASISGIFHEDAQHAINHFRFDILLVSSSFFFFRFYPLQFANFFRFLSERE